MFLTVCLSHAQVRGAIKKLKARRDEMSPGQFLEVTVSGLGLDVEGFVDDNGEPFFSTGLSRRSARQTSKELRKVVRDMKKGDRLDVMFNTAGLADLPVIEAKKSATSS